MREQVITPRAGRAGAGAKGRGAVSVQRPNGRRARPATKANGGASVLKLVLAFVAERFAFIALSLLAVCFGLVLYVGYRNAVSASFFKVKAVDVSGATRSSRDEIRAAVLRLSHAGAWQSDLEVIAKELKELPWVRDAVVTRVLPDGLRVRVTEREPRLIARTDGGRLVWVDDDGLQLGAATPRDEDFFIRGLDDSAGAEARRANRERMALALEFKADWEREGLSKRVSELDLADLRDVRVHLSGADSGIRVSLIAPADGAAGGDADDDTARRRDYSKRFRDALRTLDQQGRMSGSKCVSYIVMTPGRHPVFGYHPCGAIEAAGGADAAAGAPPPAEAAPPAKDPAKKAETPRRPAKPEERKAGARPAPAAATRPRRVG